jgi:molecular chaperone GrpE
MEEPISEPEAEILSTKTDTKEAEPVKNEVETLKHLLSVEHDKHLRLMAEFDNMRKRNERERIELFKYAHEEVIIECLKVYDDLERSLSAFKAKEGTDANLIKGLQMVYDNLKEVMNKYDVKPVEAVGKVFDPNAHEVLMMIEGVEHPDNTVVEEFQKGYTLAGKVVRTSKVKVQKNNG